MCHRQAAKDKFGIPGAEFRASDCCSASQSCTVVQALIETPMGLPLCFELHSVLGFLFAKLTDQRWNVQSGHCGLPFKIPGTLCRCVGQYSHIDDTLPNPIANLKFPGENQTVHNFMTPQP